MRIFVPSAATLLTDSAGHGEGLIAWGILSGLAARGHELVVCAERAELTAAPPFELHETGRPARLESLAPLARARCAGRLFERLGGSRRFDLVHWLFPQQPEEAVLAPPAGLPVVVGPLFAPWPAGSRTRPLRLGDAVRGAIRPLLHARHRRLLRGSLALLATPDAVRPGVVRSRVLGPGVDAARFSASPPADGSQILFVGTLERAKGVRDLVEAFAQLRRTRPEAELVLAGEGPDRAWIDDAQRRLGLNGSLRLLGAVAHPDVPALLAASTLFCLPSHGEPYGMAVVEAMAAGRAVVGTDTGGPRYLVDREHGGRLVPAGDPAALADALGELLNDRPVLAAAGAFNRSRVERELGLEPVLDALEDAYRDVTGR